MKRSFKVILIILLILSFSLNVKFFLVLRDKPWFVNFSDANTRETYETVHHVKEAQKISTGKEIKVGILDKYFGFKKHNEVYVGGMDFLDDKEKFEEVDEHGFWMATTLKEIAPDVKIYALNARSTDKDKEAQAIVSAINWAIENNINILTYSGEAFTPEQREKIDGAVKKAIDHNIVTTFIHYDLPENILPYGLWTDNSEGYSRAPDVNILHYDYNVLLLFQYENYVNVGRKAQSGNDIPFFSVSSTSPVLAGFVAMLMEIKKGLPPAEYKQILMTSSREYDYKGKSIKHVIDAPKAIDYIKIHYQNTN